MIRTFHHKSIHDDQRPKTQAISTSSFNSKAAFKDDLDSNHFTFAMPTSMIGLGQHWLHFILTAEGSSVSPRSI